MFEAASYLQSLDLLWSAASLEEQRDITRIMLKAIYVDVVAGQIVKIEPLPMFAKLLKEVCERICVEIVS
ncbi:MAG: hypothetical protein HC804_04380 [Anaerolineae bacterium]|nr:hypothetical protein [Anaerolineae bacterium]